MSGIRQPSCQFNQQTKEKLAAELTRVLAEDWGAPKTAMAISYYQSVIIPDLINCLEKNLHAAKSAVFMDILTNKLHTQFGFPFTFASGLAGDIIKAVERYYPLAPAEGEQQFEPWERLLVMFSLGEPVSSIIDRTGFSQQYVELIQRQYRHFLKTAKELGPKSFHSFMDTDLAEYDERLLKYIYTFWRRFDDPHYLVRLAGENIAVKLGVKMLPEEILGSLVLIHDFEGQVSASQMVDLLKDGSSAANERVELFTGTWPLKRYSQEDIAYFLERMLEGGYLFRDKAKRLQMSTSTAQLVGDILTPQIVSGVLDSIISGKAAKAEAGHQLAALNIYVLEKVIDRLARTGAHEVVEILQHLPQLKNKKIHLKVLWALGEIASTAGVSFVIESMQHRDAMIRARACEAMGRIGDSSGFFALMRCLDDSVNGVKEQALIAIGRIGLRSALKKVKEIANDLEESIHVRHIAWEVVEELKNK